MYACMYVQYVLCMSEFLVLKQTAWMYVCMSFVSVDLHRQVHPSGSYSGPYSAVHGPAAPPGGGQRLPQVCVAGVGLHQRTEAADSERLLQARIRWIR